MLVIEVDRAGLVMVVIDRPARPLSQQRLTLIAHYSQVPKPRSDRVLPPDQLAVVPKDPHAPPHVTPRSHEEICAGLGTVRPHTRIHTHALSVQSRSAVVLDERTRRSAQPTGRRQRGAGGQPRREHSE